MSVSCDRHVLRTLLPYNLVTVLANFVRTSDDMLCRIIFSVLLCRPFVISSVYRLTLHYILDIHLTFQVWKGEGTRTWKGTHSNGIFVQFECPAMRRLWFIPSIIEKGQNVCRYVLYATHNFVCSLKTFDHFSDSSAACLVKRLSSCIYSTI